MKISLITEFKEFLKEYKVVGIAIGIVIGLATVALVNSLVSDVIMPVVTAFIPNGAWKEAVFTLGPIVIKWGSFLGALINFIIIAFVVFLIAKLFMKEEKVTKK